MRPGVATNREALPSEAALSGIRRWRKSGQRRTVSRNLKRYFVISVLPFANLSRDAGDEYFSDGLAEEIINALNQILTQVIARTSAFAFKGKKGYPQDR
jgi:TolB-like protein